MSANSSKTLARREYKTSARCEKRLMVLYGDWCDSRHRPRLCESGSCAGSDRASETQARRRLARRGAKSGSWSSSGIGVKADTDRAFANRVVARNRIEYRKQRLDRRLALHSRNHEALFEGGQRGEPPDRLYLGRGSFAFGESPFHLFRWYILDLLRAHVYAHRDQLAIDVADDLFIAPRQQARHVAQRYARSFERTHQRPQSCFRGYVVVHAIFYFGEHRTQGRHVEKHGQGAELRMQRQRESPLLDELVDGRLLRRLDLRVGNPARLGGRDHLRVEGVLDAVALRLHQLVLRRHGRRLDGICVVEHQADITDTPHA